jgi:hypothetical protein
MLNKKLLCFLVILLTFPNAFAAQGTRSPSGTKRSDQKTKTSEKPALRVTVNLKRGAVVTGDFVQANKEIVEIEVAGVRQRIAMDDVASLVFEVEQRSSSAPSRDSILAVEAAVKSLRKLGALTVVKPAFPDYQSRLIDVKVDVEDALARLPEGNLKAEIKLALEAFIDAENVWDQLGDVEVILPSKDEQAAKLMEKYAIPPIEPNADPTKLRLDRDTMLVRIWASAREHLDKLQPLLTSYAVGQ